MHIKRSLGLAAAVLVLAASAQAQGKNRSKGKWHGQTREHGHVRTSARAGFPDDHNIRWNGVRVPPGLAKKPGHMPPGQYKRRYGTNHGAIVLGDIMRRRGYSGIRVVPSGLSQYVYYRSADGAQRHAIVSPGTDRLRFQNVPTTCLQDVLARLY